MKTLAAGSIVVVPSMVPVHGTELVDFCGAPPGALCTLGGFTRLRLSAPAEVLSEEQVTGYVYLGGGIPARLEDSTPLVRSGGEVPDTIYVEPGTELVIGEAKGTTRKAFPAVVLEAGSGSTVQALQDPSLVSAWTGLVGQAFDAPRIQNPFYDPPAPVVSQPPVPSVPEASGAQAPAPVPAAEEPVPVPVAPVSPRPVEAAGTLAEKSKFALWIAGAGVLGWLVGYLIARYTEQSRLASGSGLPTTMSDLEGSSVEPWEGDEAE